MVLREFNSGESSSYQICVHFYSFCEILYFVMVVLGCNIPSFRAELFQDV